MDEKTKLNLLKKQLKELQEEVDNEDKTKGIVSSDREEEQTTTEGIMIEGNGKLFSMFRDYNSINSNNSNLKRLIR